MDRDKIIEYLKNFSMKKQYVNAMWLEGADGTGRVDEYSDIDVWFDVDKSRQESSLFYRKFRSFEKNPPCGFFERLALCANLFYMSVLRNWRNWRASIREWMRSGRKSHRAMSI